MTPYVLLLCTGFVTLAAAEPLQTACWKQDVSSWGWRDHEERVNVLASGTATSMTVEREHYDVSESLSLCKKNETFGFTETKLWVSGGCRATFTVCYDQSNTCDAKINAMQTQIERLETEQQTQIERLETEQQTQIERLETEQQTQIERLETEQQTQIERLETEQQTQIERLEGIVNTLNATVTEMAKDEAVDNQDTVQPVELSNGLTLQYDNDNAGGPWLIFQLRTSGSVDFNLKWANYTTGFGDTENYWLGLDLVYSYCNETNKCKLRVDVARNGVAKYAMYNTFYLDGPNEKFTIHLAGYSGDAGDSMLAPDPVVGTANGMKFSTADDDNDMSKNYNLAKIFSSPWWWDRAIHKGGKASLNGVYGAEKEGYGPYWYEFSGDGKSLTSTAMKLSQIPQ